MADWARLHQKFDQHPKVQQVSLAAVGLWTLCNSRSRRNRTSGSVPRDWVADHLEQANELVEAKLWLRDGDNFRFNDWADWNADENPRTTSAKLVSSVIPQGHPDDVIAKLTKETSDLLVEGIEYEVVKAALKLWLGKSNAAPSWLPMLVSDVIRQGGYAERDAALREAWKTGDLKPLARFGLVFTPPDLPMSITTVSEAKAWMFERKREWIVQVREQEV